MGCVNSTPDDGPGARPVKRAESPEIVLPNVEWEINTEWSAKLESEWKRAVETRNEKKFRANFQSFLQSEVRKWIDNAEPACAKSGSIEDMGKTTLCVGQRECKYPAKSILTLDDDFTGVIYSAAIVVVPPLKGKGADEPWMKAGAALQTDEMKAAQTNQVALLTLMREQGVNVEHALIHVFMGADLVSCKFNSTASEPTITMLPHQDKPTDELAAGNEALVELADIDPTKMPVQFPSLIFMTALVGPEREYPGCTIWDEGEFLFSVDGVPYEYPTRLLVARDFKKMSEMVDTHHFQVLSSQDPNDTSDVSLVRNLDPEKDPGGVVYISLILGIDPKVVWPKIGAYANSPALAAAEKAVLEYVKTLHKNGKVRACSVKIYHGADRKSFKFVSNASVVVSETKNPECIPVPESNRRQYSGLDGFMIDLKEQRKHNLFESESHFQAIKQHMLSRAQENPEFFNAIVPQVAVMSATHVLSANFPGCVVSDEGEFPATLPDGTEMNIANSRLMLVKDPKQEPKSIVAAMHVVPDPTGGGQGSFLANSKANWLESKEMKVAEYMLLELLKKLHAQGKVSEVDCMAQVMMGTDATIYQFVEGSRFIDYSDERMAQFRWD